MLNINLYYNWNHQPNILLNASVWSIIAFCVGAGAGVSIGVGFTKSLNVPCSNN